MFRIFKWSGLVLCLFIFAAFLFSSRRAIDWTSHDTHYQISLISGMIGFGWRPEGWKIKNEKYPARPGWSGIASYGNNNPHITWWFDIGSHNSWEWVLIPLWIPLLIFSPPTILLWYRDRNTTYQFIQKIAIKVCPSKLKKITARMVIVWSLIHFLVVAFATALLLNLDQFFSPVKKSYDLGEAIFECLVFIMFSAPLWGILWSFLYIAFLNKLFFQFKTNHCTSCGYDLTGNVSGICSECGTPVIRRA